MTRTHGQSLASPIVTATRLVAEVAVMAPVPGTFTYLVPEAMSLVVGTRVWVPFGARSLEGVVLSVAPATGTGALTAGGRRLKAVREVVDSPPLDGELLGLARWMAEYYMAPVGEAVRLLLPPGGRAMAPTRIALSDEGRVAATSLGKALEPEELHGLGLRERALIEQLATGSGSAKLAVLARSIDGAAAAIRALERRGLVTRRAEVNVRQERTEEIVRMARDALDGEPVLARSATRRAVYERIALAGEIPVAALRAEPPSQTAPDPYESAPNTETPVAVPVADGGRTATAEPTATQVRAALKALTAAGLVTVERRVPLDPFKAAAVERTTPPKLTEDQARAVAALEPALASDRYAPFLLHGATGSGKTEVYLRLIERALARGRGALALVPEISLTPQLANRFRARFGDEVAVLHSSLSDGDRFDAWMRLKTGRVRIALGARSAVFAPVANLGVVVIDEEHDGSFKQEEGPLRYHGRDVAMRRARDAGALAILGSATPSLETFEATREGRVQLLSLPGRANARPMPSVQVIDLRRHKPDSTDMLSSPLVAALTETLAFGEQAILFLNRRGFASFILCTACGHRFSCAHCAVTLTYHRATERLACHYCGYLEPSPARCPACQSPALERLGLGTERLEAQLRIRFPSARIARLDRDTASGLVGILDDIRARKVDILVGTQMVAKGHDFPGVTLVGVVLADHGMGLPDFRASERTFQLLAQVAGRAGRGERPGRVLVQTFMPQHSAVVHAAQHDFLGFYTEEREHREELSYPPFLRMGLVRIDGADPAVVERAAKKAAAAAREMADRAPAEAGIAVLGPSEAPISRLKDRTRWHLFVKARSPKAIRAVLTAALGIEALPGVRLSADVDPVSIL